VFHVGADATATMRAASDGPPTIPRVTIIIVGIGRVGAWLARSFDGDGHRVTLVDILPSAFRRIGEDFGGEMVVGTALDETVLKRAGIEHADAFVSVTNGDNRNIMAAEIARAIFKVPRVIARVYDPVRASTYRELGLETICSTSIVGGMISDFLLTGDNRADSLEGGAISRATAAPE
jgi:trk system potassium uptake protein TrkA